MRPTETAIIESPESAVGRIIEFLGRRRGELIEMRQKGQMHELEFRIPARGLIGARTAILTLSQGEAILHHVFHSYQKDRGSFPRRQCGVLIASETGAVSSYALDQLQDRGTFFVRPTEPAYAGMIVGENGKDDDLTVNVCKQKKLNNIRSSTKEQGIRLNTPRTLGVEEALEFIEDDEMVEVTPKNIRLRKRILDEKRRKRLQGAV